MSNETQRQSIPSMLVERFVSPQFLLAAGTTIVFWWLLNALMNHEVPDKARELVSTMIGFLAGNMVGPAFQFFFGTTASSERKTQALADQSATSRILAENPAPLVTDTATVIADTATVTEAAAPT